MPSGGQVNITVADGGSASIIVPGSSVQLVIGCCSSGTVNQIVATRSPATLQSTLGYGPLVEAAALACLAGGTVLAIKVPSTTHGTAKTVQFTGSGTSVITTTLDGTNGAFDDYFVVFKVIAGGTIGIAGITFQLSLDAGRNFGPVLALGTANTYAIPNTGITLNFAAGTLVAADKAQFQTVAPIWNTAGIQAALQAFQASAYAIQGVGSTHIVGVAAGTDVTTIEGYLDTLATGYVFTRAFFAARDANAPTTWGGAGETEATWMAAIQTDYSSVSAKRACVGAGHWNMPTAFPQASTVGAPAYRRNVAWAAAARQVTLPPQRHLGRVKDGPLAQVVINASSDPSDGFLYHDERINPGLDYLIAGSGGRFMSTMTRTGIPGVFVSNPLTMAPLGSDFFLMPLGNVMDVLCSLVHQVGQLQIDDDVRLNANGTIYENDARNIESALASAVNSTMFAPKMISQPVGAGPSASAGSSVIVDRTTNVRSTSQVNATVTIAARGYVLTENITVGFLNPNAAA